MKSSVAWAHTDLQKASALKLRVARILTADPVGWLINEITRSQISHQGLRIDASGPQFTHQVRAQMFWGFYEAAETRMIRKYLSGREVVVELGSSLGITSAHVASIMAPRGRLICVEANANLASALLRGTLGRFAESLGIQVVHAAIADHDGEAQFLIAERTVSSELWLEAAATGEGHLVSVPALTLRTLLERHAVAEFDLIADIEGAESTFLVRDPSTLQGCRRAVLELHETRGNDGTVTVSDLLGGLLKAGFRLLDQDGPVVAVERV